MSEASVGPPRFGVSAPIFVMPDLILSSGSRPAPAMSRRVALSRPQLHSAFDSDSRVAMPTPHPPVLRPTRRRDGLPAPGLSTSRLCWIAAAVVLVRSGSVALIEAAEPRPSFVVINIDDLGYSDIGPFGSANATPHLDRMAREGRRLTSHYAAPVCSPSRAALLTGCYPKRVLPIPHVLFPASSVGLHSEETTIAELLRDAGYATACIGKWHLGDQPEFLPTRQGFDVYYGLPYSNDMGPVADGAKSNPGQPLPKAAPAGRAARGQPERPQPEQRQPARPQVAGDETGIHRQQPPLPLLDQDQVVERVRQAEQFTLTRRYTERAVQFLRERRDQPFFLYLPHTAVHFPHYPAEEYRGTSSTSLYADWVREVDWSVGQILDALRELQLESRTLVLFTSDNGGPVNQGASNGPLRGSKGQTHEGGIRVCTVAWWPGKIPSGTSTDAITTMMDVLPTFARLAGAALPSGRRIDGVDIWPVLAGSATAPPPREEFCYFRGLRLEAVRSGPWKLQLLPPNHPADRPAPAPSLYHLGTDLGETRDVAGEHAEIVARLRELAAAMDADLGAAAIGPGCRPLGRVEHPQPLIPSDPDPAGPPQ